MTDWTIHDDRICLLGEGPLWHPERKELFWFDILGRRLYAKGRQWSFQAFPTAAGWIDLDRLFVASSAGLGILDLARDHFEILTAFPEAVVPIRSNDGRADPKGGFWIGTMGVGQEPEVGAIWRYWRGELRQIHRHVSIPNAICFAPDGSEVFWTDTETQVIHRQVLDAKGWPVGEARTLVDLRGTEAWPDGAVMDGEGRLWNAQWGEARVVAYDMDGREVARIGLPAAQTTCPAIGTDGTLYVTSAACGLPQPHLAAHPETGRTFALPLGLTAVPEPRVLL